jgi:hypothetical protein
MCWFKQIVTKPVYLFSFMYPTTDIKKNTMLQADCYQTGLSLLLHVHTLPLIKEKHSYAPSGVLGGWEGLLSLDTTSGAKVVIQEGIYFL